MTRLSPTVEEPGLTETPEERRNTDSNYQQITSDGVSELLSGGPLAKDASSDPPTCPGHLSTSP